MKMLRVYIKIKMLNVTEDTCLVSAEQDLATLLQNIKEACNNGLNRWVHDDVIILNISKTKFVHISSDYMKKPVALSLYLRGRDSIACACPAMVLIITEMVTVDDRFNWTVHMDTLFVFDCDRYA